MSQRILIITNKHDLHADLVGNKLISGGGHPFRLDLDEFPAMFDLTVDFEGDGTITYLPTGDMLRLSDIGAVWTRKKAEFQFRSRDLGAQETAFATAETEHILFSLLYGLDCFWMSHPLAIRSAQWKVEQLMRARKMGFSVPDSLITNARSQVEAFRREGANGVVFKSLSSSRLGDGTGKDGAMMALPTIMLDDEDEELLDAVAELPCFFQHYIPKRHELRVTIVGEQAFAAKIHSQSDARTRVDFRDFSAEILYEAEALPSDVEQRCLQFVQSYGLTFGAIDLIVTPDGDHVFLENNPVGQFLFVEQLVPELGLTGAVAQCLLEGCMHKRLTNDREIVSNISDTHPVFHL